MAAQQRPSFDPDDLIGLPAAEAEKRLKADGHTWIVVEPERSEGAPITLEMAPSRVRLSTRDSRVVKAEIG
jgi:hypothetical protein